MRATAGNAQISSTIIPIIATAILRAGFARLALVPGALAISTAVATIRGARLAVFSQPCLALLVAAAGTTIGGTDLAVFAGPVVAQPLTASVPPIAPAAATESFRKSRRVLPCVDMRVLPELLAIRVQLFARSDTPDGPEYTAARVHCHGLSIATHGLLPRVGPTCIMPGSSPADV